MFLKRTHNVLSRFNQSRRKAYARLVAFALLFNILTASFMPAAMASSLADSLLTDSHVVVICTPQGMKRIILDEDGIPHEDPENTSEYCSSCLSFNKIFSADQYNVAAFYIPEIERHIHTTSTNDIHHRDLIALRNASPRAPPLS